MKHTKTVLLFNEKSRKSTAGLQDILDECERHGITVGKVYKNKDGIKHAIKDISSNAPDLVLIGGGDGTVSTVLGLLTGIDVTIGIIPLGTTNNYARSIGMPLNLPEAIACIKRGQVKQVDLGVVNERYFANVVGIGVSAIVAKNVSNHMKKVLGRAAYGVEGFKQLFVQKPFHATIEDADKQLRVHVETRQLIVANGRFHAGKKIAEDASINDGQLIVFALGGRSRLSFLIAMLDFYVGAKKKIRHTSYLIAKDVIINTSSTQSIEVDGEVVSDTPASLHVATKVVKVIVGDQA